MQKLAAAFLLLLSGTVAAQQVFRSYDEDGNVVFSDQPSPGAEEIEVQPVQGFTAPPVPEADSSLDDPDGNTASGEFPGYDTFGIVAPSNDDTIRSNPGNVDVAVTIQPSLRAGDTLRVLMDGNPLGEMSGPYVRLENVDRGTHTITVEALDPSGSVVSTTEPVTFHLHRQSVITRERQGRN